MGNMLRRGISAYQQTMGTRPFVTPDSPQNSESAPKQDLPAPEKAQGLLKTTVPEDSRARRVAKFLILIGSEQAAKVLGELDKQQVEEISREITSIEGIGEEEAAAILAEFTSLLSAPCGYAGASGGGVEAARRMLYTAYGPEKGEALLNRAVPGSKENIFGFLEEFSPEQLVFLLKDESSAAAALVLARLSPGVSAETLGKFPPSLKPEILRRIARQSEVAPEVLESVAASIRDKARHLGSGGSKDIAIDGMQTLTAILRQGDYAFGDRLITELETESPGIGKDLKNRLYTLDDVLDAFDRPLAEKLVTMPDRTIAILLKDRDPEFCEKILSNVSVRRRSMIREEAGILGEIAVREYNDVVRDFLAWFRLAREKGELALAGDKDWVV